MTKVENPEVYKAVWEAVEEIEKDFRSFDHLGQYAHCVLAILLLTKSIELTHIFCRYCSSQSGCCVAACQILS